MIHRTARFIMAALLLTSLGFAASAQDEATSFTVTIENISGQALFDNFGVFNTPIDAEEAGPAFPGSGYSFSFDAEAGQSLHFATMLVQSNDLFYSPDENGIALFDDNGDPISGDVTDQIQLWDAGTEVNQEPGVGEDQAPRQAGPNTGEGEFAPVLEISQVGDGFEYPAVSDYISVEIDGMGSSFTVTINNIGGETAIPGPIAPGVFVVTDETAPLFQSGALDYGQGLEAIAEDGNPAISATVFGGIEGAVVGPIAPGVFIVHSDPAPLFTTGEPDRGEGLEGIAEDGDPSGYADSDSAVIFNTPVDGDGPGPALPGSAYSFTFDAVAGDNINFATMFVQSNDLFYGPNEAGIPLFDDMGAPLTGNVTRYIQLWDAGTELNEEPGVGENQAPRQSGPDTGEDEMGVVLDIADVMDEFSYPPVAAVVRVTVTVNE